MCISIVIHGILSTKTAKLKRRVNKLQLGLKLPTPKARCQ